MNGLDCLHGHSSFRLGLLSFLMVVKFFLCHLLNTVESKRQPNARQHCVLLKCEQGLGLSSEIRCLHSIHVRVIHRWMTDRQTDREIKMLVAARTQLDRSISLMFFNSRITTVDNN